jgi:chromosome segregation ATPase
MPTNEHTEPSPKVYLPKLPAESFNNQSRFQHNYLQEYLLNQKRQNENLSTLVTKFQEDSFERQEEHFRQISAISSKMEVNDSVTNELLTRLSALDQETSKIEEQLESLVSLSKEQKEIMKEESLRHTALFDQLTFQEQDISLISQKMDEFNHLASEMKTKFDETETSYHNISEKLDLQEVFHQTILESMEETNGNVNKLSRQIEHMKEILFERVHYLAEKIENNVKSIAQPIHRFFLQSEKDETTNK